MIQIDDNNLIIRSAYFLHVQPKLILVSDEIINILFV